MARERKKRFPDIETWDYRVLKKKQGKDTIFAIHEVYYDKKGKPLVCTEEPCEPMGETMDELKKDMRHYQLALKKPVLDYDGFK